MQPVNNSAVAMAKHQDANRPRLAMFAQALFFVGMTVVPMFVMPMFVMPMFVVPMFVVVMVGSTRMKLPGIIPLPRERKV